MKNDFSPNSIQRRQFITRSCAVGTSLCLGCWSFFSFVSAKEAETNKLSQDKFSENSGMSYEQVFNFAYRDLIIPQLLAVSRQIGRDKFVGMLKGATDEVYSQTEIMKRWFANLPKEFPNSVLNLEVVENKPNLRIFKISKCLWAKTFREAEAADIGYAILCYGDDAAAKSNNEKLERETTLMQGHDCCLLKWTKIG
jgi:hypothetical protein